MIPPINGAHMLENTDTSTDNTSETPMLQPMGLAIFWIPHLVFIENIFSCFWGLQVFTFLDFY